MSKSVFLVDDDEAIRHSASFMLRHAGYRVKTFADGETFLEELPTLDDAGCILLDVRMPGMDGLQVQAVMNDRGVGLPVIILTGHGEVDVAVQAMKAGAVEFLEKPYDKKTLLGAIEAAFDRLEEQSSDAKRTAEAKARLSRLTAREHEVLDCLVNGLTNKAIADALSISPRTVEIHRANVMNKLEAESLSAALRLAFTAGLGRVEKETDS
ncbi:MAG: response regulator [Pseudomonadota bacterium]